MQQNESHTKYRPRAPMCEAHESFTHPHRAPFSSSGGGGTELVTLTATSFFVYPSLNSKTILYHPLII